MSPEGTAPDQTPIGRMISSYRIEALIGVGGMGQVFRAWDEKLGRTVAVKVLREYHSQDEIARKRFVREARLSSSIVHPYVATVFDVVEENGDVYLVMEYVEGRTLNQILKRRTLSIPEVARYGREIAEALNVIHCSGLVHRDLKPSNVMITNDNHIKVMDFGLARQFAGDPRDPDGSSLTRSGMVAGTPAYMSPEQLRGQSVDNRSDLFSLGIVLYEAVTGQHPFIRETLGESMSAIINDPPGGESEPRSLSQSSAIRATILRLLEKDPDRRYQSAEELIPRLELPTDEVAAYGGLAGRTRRRPWMTPALVTLAVAAVGLGIWWLGKGAGRASVPQTVVRPLVAVLPFEDHTRAGEHSGEMLAALLSADLAESKVARSVGHDRVVEIVAGVSRGAPKSAYIDAIQSVANVAWVVVGSVFPQGEAYEAVLDVYRPNADEPHASIRVGAASAAGLAGLAAVRIQEAIDPRTSAGDAPEESGRASESEEALLFEYEGRKAIREHRFTDAIDALETALEIDPGFTAAQLWLAAVLDVAGYGERARDAADRALRMIEGPGGRASYRTGLEVRALHAELHGDRENEIDIRRQLVERYPDEPETLDALAESLWRAARHDEALAYVERSLALGTRDPWRHDLLALILNALGRHEAALAALDRAEGLFELINSEGGVARTMQQRAHVDWSRGSNEAASSGYQAAAEVFERAGMEELAADARSHRANVLLELGDLATAQAIFDRSIPIFRRFGNLRQVSLALTGLGYVYTYGGDYDRAETAFREAIEQADELKNPALLLAPTTNLASILIYTNRIGEGRRVAERALEISRLRKDRASEATLLTLLADVDYQRGKLSESERSYRDLIELAEAPGADSENLIWAVMGITEVLQARGDLAGAIKNGNRAVELAGSNGNPQTLGYALFARARVLGELLDRNSAEADLAAAEQAARETGQELADLAAKIGLARAELDAREQNWRTGLEHAKQAHGFFAGAGSLGMAAESRILESEIVLGQGEAAEAARLAAKAIEAEGTRATDRTRARLILARAYRALERFDESADLGLQALDEAGSMGAALPTAMAATLLVSLPPGSQPSDAETVRSRGRAALERYLDSVPEDRRKRQASRRDIVEAMKELSPSP